MDKLKDANQYLKKLRQNAIKEKGKLGQTAVPVEKFIRPLTNPRTLGTLEVTKEILTFREVQDFLGIPLFSDFNTAHLTNSEAGNLKRLISDVKE